MRHRIIGIGRKARMFEFPAVEFRIEKCGFQLSLSFPFRDNRERKNKILIHVCLPVYATS